MDKKLIDAWDSRAKIFKTEKEAVMQQSFPKIVNDYIHKLHLKEVLKVLPAGRANCLDIGCGYGRIALEITKEKNNIFVYGVDISKVFVDLFNKRLDKRGKAVVGSLTNLPFEDNKFDYVICIVTMMYLEKIDEQRKAISEMLRVLKKGGRIILIEPNRTGDDIVKLFGFLPYFLRKILKKKKIETFGISFPFGRIDNFIRETGGIMVGKKGYAFLTISLLFILALSKISKRLAAFFLKIVNFLDNLIPLSNFSYIVTYVIKKA